MVRINIHKEEYKNMALYPNENDELSINSSSNSSVGTYS